MITNTLLKRGKSSMLRMAQRFYSKGQEPHVFINQHTKVICQGMTGKEVRLVFAYHRPCCFVTILQSSACLILLILGNFPYDKRY